MGFGHRVYKNHPRAVVMQKTCDEVLAGLGIDDEPLSRIARKLEKVALEDPCFIEEALPNVDFYSALFFSNRHSTSMLP